MKYEDSEQFRFLKTEAKSAGWAVINYRNSVLRVHLTICEE